MPRRPTEVLADIPLFLIPHVILQRIRQVGEDLERVTVKRTRRHFYTVSIRTRPVKREFQSERARTGEGV
ncbi:MAG: hypothetical protein PHD55_11865 [Methanoregula sp.]|nr:hypothetical protein [Methanoregula sp.]